MNQNKAAFFLTSPFHLMLFISSIVILAWAFPPSPTILPQRYWYVEDSQIWIIIIGILSMNTGIILARIHSKSSIGRNSLNYIPSNYSPTNFFEKYGRIFFWLSLLGYICWILFDFNGWTNYTYYGHLKTIPGITTLSQFMPISISLLYFHDRTACTKRNQKFIVAIILITFLRSVVNHERLALLEVVVPLLFIWLLTSNSEKVISLPKLYVFSLGGIFGLFSANEYFRSWQYYRNYIDLNYFQFSAERLLNYYSTALNNGAVYLNTHTEISNIPIYTLDFLWSFPLLGNYFSYFVPSSSTGLDFNSVLRSTMGTDEFNNIQPFFQIVAEFNLPTLFFLNASIFYLLAVLHSKCKVIDSAAIPIYAVIAVGLLEYPRIFWFGSGRSFPLITSAIFLLIRFHRSSTIVSRKLEGLE